MALDAHRFPSTLDRSAYQYVDDYKPIWEAMATPMNRLMFLDMVPQGDDLTEPEFYWTEDNASIRSITLAEDVDNSETEIDVTSGHEEYVQIGDLLHGYHNGTTEWMQVTSASDTVNHRINVTRAVYGSGEAHTNGNTLKIVRLRPQGSDRDQAEFKGTTRRYNYSGIISHTVELTGTAQAGQPRAAYGDELDRQEAEILTNLKFELEDMLLYGPGIATSDTPEYGAMLGVRGNIVARAGDNYISTGEYRWTYKQANQDLNWLARQGFIKPNSNIVIFGPPDMATTAAEWKASQVTYEVSDRTYGLEVPVLISALGIRAPLLWNPDAKSDEYMILNLDRIKKHAMAGRSLIRMREPKFVALQDYEGRRLLMDWGLSIQYAQYAHFLRTGVDFSGS